MANPAGLRLLRQYTQPQEEWAEPFGPPRPWDLYSLLVAISNSGLPKGSYTGVDKFRFTTMRHSDQVEAIEFYRRKAVEEEVGNQAAIEEAQRAEQARQATVQREADLQAQHDARVAADIDERMGAW